MADIDYKAKIDDLNDQLEAELGEWMELQVDPNQLFTQTVFNPMNIAVWLRCITDFLVQKGVIENEDEFIVFMKERMMEDLTRMRAQVEPQVREARLKEKGITIHGPMDIPKGKVRKLH